MEDDTIEVVVPRRFRIRKDMARLTFGHEVEYHLPLDHPLTRLIRLELEQLPQDRLLWAIIATLLRHWWDDGRDRLTDAKDVLVGLIRGAYQNRKKIRENRRGRLTFHWKDGHVQPPEITILPLDGEDDGDGNDTLGRIEALPAPAMIVPSISLPSLPRTHIPRRK